MMKPPRPASDFTRHQQPPPSTGEQPAPDPAALRARVEAHQRAHPARPAPAPPDPGRILARFSRPDGTELRVSLHSYEGKPYVRVAPWQSSAPDAWPVKGKGSTVRVRELAGVAAALLDAMDAMEADNDAPANSAGGPRR